MMRKFEFSLHLIIIYLIVHSLAGKCPPSELLYPCLCGSDTIICSGENSINIKQIFEKISDKLGVNEKHFDLFKLNNTAITELEENVFRDITFNEIVMITPNLTLMNERSLIAEFTAINTLNIFRSKLKNQLPSYNVWDMFSSFINLEKLQISTNFITEIPDKAFRPLLGLQSKLENIDFGSNSIESIGNIAFYELDNLKYLNPGVGVNYIHKDAFKFKRSSNYQLIIDLASSKVNDTSFEDGAFTNSKRPLTIDLRNTLYLKYLPENTFEPFLSSDMRNKLRLGNEKVFECDCRMKWIIKKEHFKEQIVDGVCTNGKPIWDQTQRQIFENCI